MNANLKLVQAAQAKAAAERDAVAARRELEVQQATKVFKPLLDMMMACMQLPAIAHRDQYDREDNPERKYPERLEQHVMKLTPTSVAMWRSDGHQGLTIIAQPAGGFNTYTHTREDARRVTCNEAMDLLAADIARRVKPIPAEKDEGEHVE